MKDDPKGNSGIDEGPPGSSAQRLEGFAEVVLRWYEGLARTSSVFRGVLCFALLVAVATVDISTGTEVSFSIFYLLPVSAAGGLLTTRTGRVVALISAVLWTLGEIRGAPYSATWIPFWNGLVRFGFFMITNELIGAVRKAHLRERDLARTDRLTGLANGRMFREHADWVLAAGRREGRPFTIAYLDLDGFKSINDRFGHSERDRLLQQVAGCLRGATRQTDLVARLGGDEFVVLMPSTAFEQARIVLERVVAEIGRDLAVDWDVGVTVGAVTFSESPGDVDAAVGLADALMYEGKAAGRGRIVHSQWPPTAVRSAPPSFEPAVSGVPNASYAGSVTVEVPRL